MKKSSRQQAQTGTPAVGRHRRETAKFKARDLALWKAQAKRNVKRAEGTPVTRRAR